jgi:hypothetical protein
MIIGRKLKMTMIKKNLFIIILLITGLIRGYTQNPETIIKAIEFGELETFKQEVDMLDDLNEPIVNGYTILNYSIIKGRVDFIEYLLTKNVDIEKESENQTPLMYSARYHSEILKLLISKGADINREIDGVTALIIALEEGNQDAIDILAANGATAEIRGGVDGPYILYDTLLNITTMVTINEQNKLIVDTLSKAPKEIMVTTPFNESFTVKLKRPKREWKSRYHKKPDKIFAISDIEGNYYDFVTSLKNNGIIDDELNWKFGKGHLVLLGDFVDRGQYVTQVLWLIYKLEQEAKNSGGKVHYILGNHEIMMIAGYYKYVNIRYKILSYKCGINMYDLYSDQTELGAWLRSKNVIEKIGDIVFVHGGISDSLFQLNFSIPRLNRIARKSIYNPWTEITYAYDILLDDNSILWYRGYIEDDHNSGKISQESIDNILSYYKARKVVIGHTIVDDISTDYEGKVIRIDVNHYRNLSSGILIEGDKIYKAKETGEKELL